MALLSSMTSDGYSITTMDVLQPLHLTTKMVPLPSDTRDPDLAPGAACPGQGKSLMFRLVGRRSLAAGAAATAAADDWETDAEFFLMAIFGFRSYSGY